MLGIDRKIESLVARACPDDGDLVLGKAGRVEGGTPRPRTERDCGADDEQREPRGGDMWGRDGQGGPPHDYDDAREGVTTAALERREGIRPRRPGARGRGGRARS